MNLKISGKFQETILNTLGTKALILIQTKQIIEIIPQQVLRSSDQIWERGKTKQINNFIILTLA